MATAKKATKRLDTSGPKIRKPRAVKTAAPADDGIYWVVSKREFLTWEPVFVHKDFRRASEHARSLENENMHVLQKYKVSRVTLVA